MYVEIIDISEILFFTENAEKDLQTKSMINLICLLQEMMMCAMFGIPVSTSAAINGYRYNRGLTAL